MLYDVFAYSYWIGGRPCKHVTIFVKEAQKLCLVLLISFGADAYNLVRDPLVLEFTLCFYEFSAFCWRLSFVLLLLFLEKVHVLVTWCEALHNISIFLLAAEDGYDSKSCWYFKAQVC
jgi:hypothetical protein